MSVRNSEDVRKEKIERGQVIQNGSDGAVLEEHATERQLAQLLTNSLPPLKCVDEVWYVYERGYWKKTDKSLYKPRALNIQHERSRKSRMAASVLNHLEYQHQINQESLKSFHFIDEDGQVLLNCQNGVLCVSVDKPPHLLPHSPDYSFTGQISAAYLPEADAENFYHVLEDALPELDDVLLFQAFTGSILYPDSRFEAALCCYGSTGTSKSTLATGVKAALGPDIITNLTLQQICDPKCFHLHKLHFSAVNIATELNALAVSSENFKRIVSGEALEGASPIC
jgi:phage/plasmid-associated DNA primase